MFTLDQLTRNEQSTQSQFETEINANYYENVKAVATGIAQNRSKQDSKVEQNKTDQVVSDNISHKALELIGDINLGYVMDQAFGDFDGILLK